MSAELLEPIAVKPPPLGGSAEENARYLLETLEAFDASDSRDAKDVHKGILGALQLYSEEEDADKAQKTLEHNMAALQVSAYDVLQKHVGRLHKQLKQYAQKVGNRPPLGPKLRRFAQGLDDTQKGLKMMLQGVKHHDENKKEVAEKVLRRAHETLSDLDLESLV